VPHGRNQPGAAQDAQVRGQGVVRHIQPAGNLAGRQTVRLLPHEQPEGFEPCGLGEGCEGIDCGVWRHLSGLIDRIYDAHMTPPIR
jgi:hypothetical protein